MRKKIRSYVKRLHDAINSSVKLHEKPSPTSDEVESWRLKTRKLLEKPQGKLKKFDEIQFKMEYYTDAPTEEERLRVRRSGLQQAQGLLEEVAKDLEQKFKLEKEEKRNRIKRSLVHAIQIGSAITAIIGTILVVLDYFK